MESTQSIMRRFHSHHNHLPCCAAWIGWLPWLHFGFTTSLSGLTRNLWNWTQLCNFLDTSDDVLHYVFWWLCQSIDFTLDFHTGRPCVSVGLYSSCVPLVYHCDYKYCPFLSFQSIPFWSTYCTFFLQHT